MLLKLSRHIHCRSNLNCESPAAVRHLSPSPEVAGTCAPCRSLRLSDSIGLLSKQERSLGEVSRERECSVLWNWHCGGPHTPNLPFAHYFRCKCSLECGPACHKALLKPQATVPKL